MKLRRIKVKNFRLLREVELVLEDLATVVVGRNNSGKTSLAEVVRRFTDDKQASFHLQDFSAECYEEFCEALIARQAGAEDQDVRSKLPHIELRLFFEYDPKQPQLGPLSDFIVDLDMDCNEALLVMRFEAGAGSLDRLFEGVPDGELDEERRKAFFQTMRDRVPEVYSVAVWAEDPGDPENRKESSQKAAYSVLRTGFINAQRGLDDVTKKEGDVLAKILEALFMAASLKTADENERSVADKLKVAVESIQGSIDGDFRSQLTSLLPKLKSFGYPGLGGQELTTETTLDVERLLSNHTKIRYEGHEGVLLPETYNGLGMRNLIFILLQVVSFYRDFRAQPQAPNVNLVFIEEPEAHLHPQMQEVFIRQLGVVVDQLNAEHPDDPDWPIQLVISTHSSHVANEANFEAIRYFLPRPVGAPDGIWQTDVKDLRTGVSEVDPGDLKFLHQYLTLTRCDLFFADKAVLVEGTSERLMLPVMMDKHDQDADEGRRLRSQYITIMEVGGAYAHKFFKLLAFLELPALVITDLDPVGADKKKCPVAVATGSSNACLNEWFGNDCVPKGLITESEEDRTRDELRIAYQCPEAAEGPCGRTFEDAFLLANADKFEIEGANADELVSQAEAVASRLKKSEFALKYAIDDTDWTTPTYIASGLAWLAGTAVPLGTLPMPEEAIAQPQQQGGGPNDA